MCCLGESIQLFDSSISSIQINDQFLNSKCNQMPLGSSMLNYSMLIHVITDDTAI